jgi:hypothetical protein
MLWALAAWIGWWLLRDWVQASLAAILTPAWLACEWIDIAERHHAFERFAFQGLLLLALTYLSALHLGAELDPQSSGLDRRFDAASPKRDMRDQ